MPTIHAKPTTPSPVVAGGMLRENTPVEDHTREWGLYVKREDLSCPPPGPPYSKARGVYAHLLNRTEGLVGVLDAYHSQGGHAVARACQVLGKRCVNYYPEFKYEPGPREPQRRAEALGAELVGLPAGRSAILWHQARRLCEARGGYMMPNALKLPESVSETAKEVPTGRFDWVIIPAGSGTIAAGVIRGFHSRGRSPHFLVHLGSTRPAGAVKNYLEEMSGVSDFALTVIDEGCRYRGEARPGPTPPWPCSPWYELKAIRWWVKHRREYPGRVLFWNIG